MSEPVTTTIDLLRHAECEGGRIFRGRLDVALSDDGWVCMQRTIKAGPRWQRIVSSPLRRCRAFVEHAAERLDLPVEVDARLREMSFGDWEGRAVDDVWAEQGEAAAAWLIDPEASPPPGGEPLSALRARTAAWLADCLERARGEHLLAVTHGGVMRALIGEVLAMPPSAFNRLDMPWGCLSRVAVTRAEAGEMTRLLGHNLAAP